MVEKRILKILKLSFGLLICLAACNGDKSSEVVNKTEPAATVKTLLTPQQHAYSGAYIDFGDYEDDVTLETIESFDKLAGRKQAIIALSSIWGRKSFPVTQTRIIGLYGATPLIFWSPWEEPYPKDRRPARYSLTEILSGLHDAYIDDWATQARNYKLPLFVAFGIEMNGEWFPWSGLFYGAGKQISGNNSERALYEGPETFIKAYRHVVDRVRAKGASNVIWVFHANNTSAPFEPWNRIANYYPGSNYVDWIALSAYGKQFKGEGWMTFNEVFTDYYKEICAIAPDKPFMLAEWGVGEFPANGDKGGWIERALKQMSSDYPQLHAAIYWHERWQNEDLSYSNLRINSSPEALSAYRDGISNSFWIDRPLYETSSPNTHAK